MKSSILNVLLFISTLPSEISNHQLFGHFDTLFFGDINKPVKDRQRFITNCTPCKQDTSKEFPWCIPDLQCPPANGNCEVYCKPPLPTNYPANCQLDLAICRQLPNSIKLVSSKIFSSSPPLPLPSLFCTALSLHLTFVLSCSGIILLK